MRNFTGTQSKVFACFTGKASGNFLSKLAPASVLLIKSDYWVEIVILIISNHMQDACCSKANLSICIIRNTYTSKWIHYTN
jgi:hypothetical protein